MTTIPENTVSMEDLNKWYLLQEEVRKAKAAEMLLRTKIFRYFFPSPEEGTNSYKLPDGHVLKGKHNITRNIDPGTLQAMGEQFREAGIHCDILVKWEPTLKTSVYRELTEEQAHLFDQCLIIKDGSPSLEIVLPKNRATKGE